MENKARKNPGVDADSFSRWKQLKKKSTALFKENWGDIHFNIHIYRSFLINFLMKYLTCFQKAHHEGRLTGYEDDLRRCQKELRSDLFKNAEEKHRQKVIAMKVSDTGNT